MNSLFPVKVAVIRKAAQRALADLHKRTERYVHEQALTKARVRWWHPVDCGRAVKERYSRATIRIRRSMVDSPLNHPTHLYTGRATAQSLLDATEACDPGSVAYLSAEDAAFVGLDRMRC